VLWAQHFGVKIEVVSAVPPLFYPHNLTKPTKAWLDAEFQELRMARDEDSGHFKSQVTALLVLLMWFKSDLRALERWVASFTGPYHGRSVALHNAAQVLPTTCCPKAGWGSLLLSASAQLRPWLVHASAIDSFLGRAPRSVQEAIATGEELGLTPFDPNGLTSREKAFVANRPLKAFEGLPDAQLQVGANVVLRKLRFDDISQLTAGRLVNCCQHLAGAGAEAAEAAYVEGDAGVYALYKGPKMVAQAMAWRSRDGDHLVFDSVECLAALSNETMVDAFFRLAKELVGKLGIKAVAVPADCHYGVTGLLAQKGFRRIDAPEPSFELGYSDVGNDVIVLAEV